MISNYSIPKTEVKFVCLKKYVIRQRNHIQLFGFFLILSNYSSSDLRLNTDNLLTGMSELSAFKLCSFFMKSLCMLLCFVTCVAGIGNQMGSPSGCGELMKLCRSYVTSNSNCRQKVRKMDTPESGRWTHLLYFTYSCHVSINLPLHYWFYAVWTSIYVFILLLHVTSSHFCL